MKNDCEALKKQLAGLKEIHQVFHEIISEVVQEQREELMCRQFKKISGAKETVLFLLEPKAGLFTFQAAAGTGEREYSGGFLDTGGMEFRPLQKSDFTAAFSETLTIQTQNNVYNFQDRFIMVFPALAFSRVYGIFICEYEDGFAVDDGDTVELIQAFLNQLSPLFKCSVETRRLAEKGRSLELLYEIGTKLSSVRDEDELLETILDLIEKHLEVDRCSLMIVDEDRKHLKIKKAFGIDEIDTSKIKIPLGEGIAGYVAAGKRPLLIKNIAAEKHLTSSFDHEEMFRTKSLLSVPLIAQGEVIGVINVNNRKDGLPFSEEDMDLLCKIGSEIAAVLQRSYMALQLKKAKELDDDIKRSIV